MFCLDIVPAKTHCIAPKEDYSYSEEYMFVLNTAFVGRYGDVVIMLKSSSIFCEDCGLLKGHCSSIYSK